MEVGGKIAQEIPKVAEQLVTAEKDTRINEEIVATSFQEEIGGQQKDGTN